MKPSKQEPLTQWWYNVGPPSAMLAQHWVNVSCLVGILDAWQEISLWN